jgi:succinyl-diaminopimelate desuccinylase
MDALLRRIESMSGEMVDFLRDLTRIPTINPPGANYRDCAQRLGSQLERFGYDVEYVAADDCERVNVIGRMGAARPTLHFNGHIDVVPAGGGWTVDPFGGVVRDGKIFGRGTTDQKAGIAASIFAIEAIHREGIRLNGSIEQSGTVDEESGGFAGMAYLAERGYISRDRTDFVIITEPLDVDRICLGHRGVYWFEVRTLGRIAHGSMPFLGVSAISKMSDFLNEIEHRLKPALGLRFTSMPVEPPEARHPCINVNSISGGQAGSMQTPCVVDACEAVFDRRFIIEEPFEQVRGEIASILDGLTRRDPEFRYELRDLMVVQPVQADARCAVVQTLRGAVQDVLGCDAPLIASPGTYDQKHVMRLGHVDQCVAYGPGILKMAHQPDEYCRIDHLVDAAKVMALAAMRLVG